MSQIETIMLIVLGFAVALLVAMFLGKLLWGQAIGLGKRRSRRDDPATIAGLQADKDRLRAERAMLERKLELRLNDLKTRLAEQSAEVSRNRNRVERLADEINERDNTIAKANKEISNLKEQMVPLEQELVKRTHAGQKLKEEIRERDEIIQQKSDLIEGLKQQLDKALEGNAIVGQADLSAKDRLTQRINELTNLSAQIEQQRVQLTQQHSELSSLSTVIAETKTQQENSPKASSGKKAYVEKLDNSSSNLEEQLKVAEKESDNLAKELSKLDKDWNEKLKKLDDIKTTKSDSDVETNKGDKTAKKKKPSKKTAKTKKDSVKKTTSKETEEITTSDKSAPKDTPKNSNDDNEKPSNVVSLANRIRSLQTDISS